MISVRIDNLKHFLVTCLLSVMAVTLAVNEVVKAEAGQSDSARAKAFVDGFVNEAIATLADESVDQASRVQRFRSMAEWYFDSEVMGRLAAGRMWAAAGDASKIRYLKAFNEFNIITWERRLRSYAGEKVIIDRAVVNDDGTIMIHSNVRMKEGEKIAITWRLAQKQRRFTIVDIYVANMSMIITMRQDFSSLARQEGNRLQGLTEALEKKVAELNAEKTN